MAHPFTLPLAVGGYDLPQQARWRRPEDDIIPEPRVGMTDWIDTDTVGPSCRVLLFDLAKSLPQRIEGQYRRHWGLAPGLWNLYFREKINLGISLKVKHKVDVAAPQDAK